MIWRTLFLSVGIAAGSALPGWAVPGNSLVMKSNGSAAGNDWVLADTGYVGTYITLATPGSVTINVEAQGVAHGGVAPRMNVVVNDASMGWDVPAGFSTYQHTLNLPAGTHFVRTEFANDHSKTPRQLQIRNLTVAGATVLTTNTDANALAASNTYINNFRKGNVTVALEGATPGAAVDVKLKNHAFNFGTAVAGFNSSTLMDPNPAAGSNAVKYQAKIKEHFNAVVPENAGKWRENEFTRDSQWHPQLDKIVTFAQANRLRMRMHNLIWDNQQPDWVNNLVNQAGGSASAKTALREEISERIDYYVGDGDADYDDGDFAQNYYEVDVYNEMVHTPKYWNLYQAAGVAGVYNEVAAAAGPNVRIATNEYNVFQDSGDFYGNWYKDSIEQVVAAGGAVSAVGIQSYENDWEPGNGCWCSHYPVRKMQTLQNLSVLGMPITLTEYGQRANTSPARTATILEDTVRMMFGSPNATGFYMWGFWGGDIWDQRPAAAFYDANWNLTLAGQTWIDLMAEWDTDVSLMVDANGNINFDGFWGDYELTINGETFNLLTEKGTSQYSLVVEEYAPGDFDYSGLVDAADFLAWQRGESPNALSEEDLFDWMTNFGDDTPMSKPVPEPISVVMLMVGAIGLRRRQSTCGFNVN